MKTVFITGASSGIGEATAKLLASTKKYRLILAARRFEIINKLCTDLTAKFGIETLPMELDVRNNSQVQERIDGLPASWQNIDILINNAGLARGLASIENGSTEHWDEMIDTNVKGLLYVSKKVLENMIKNRSGHIVNIGSIAGKEIYSMGNVYCATKHAVDALTRSMRLDLVHYPIKVSSVCPGAVETEFSVVRFSGDEDRAKKVYDGFDNLEASDIAETIEWIISRPARVNINDVVIMPTAQPMAGMIIRKS